MATFSGLLGLDVEDLFFTVGRPFRKDAEQAIYFMDPRNPQSTRGTVYFGSKKNVAKTAARDSAALSTVIKKLPTDSPVAYWELIELSPTDRGKGLGGRVVSKVMKMLNERGVQCVVLQAFDSESFWRTQGFSPTKSAVGGWQLVMVRCLP